MGALVFALLLFVETVQMSAAAKTMRADGVKSPTEGVLTQRFVPESELMADLLQMLTRFAPYMKARYIEAGENGLGELCGAFKGENTMGSNEQGVRHNADFSMICAFLTKYARGKIHLPDGITWDELEQMARRSLAFAYSTHKANRLRRCADGRYWGSTSAQDYVWESSLWAFSVAYSAFFQWDKLDAGARRCVENLLKAECNYELQRTIPTGYVGDSKAEENGWEADILAATLGLFPNDSLAPQWFERLRSFAVNSYSQISDAHNHTVIDPHFDAKTIADLYLGPNLYDDYTLQNHNFFHTSYQNVVIQELGEAALALHLFQKELHGGQRWHTRALMHNNEKVMNDVLKWLALADGELAMPNGNDWSLFLYDQITSYSTNACFLRDADALLLENLAYQMIKARQTTTDDGSWLLRADVGARRMGVQAHRVMMSWLMHSVRSTAEIAPTTWSDFNRRHAAAKLFTTQNVVRAATKDRFTCFSWSTGKRSYTGYIAANSVDKNKIIVPYREHNTGNFLGFYTVQGKKTDAVPVLSGYYDLQGNGYAMNGELNTNEAALNHRFVLYSTSGNAVVLLDEVRANVDGTITGEKAGLMAVSVDELTRTERTFHHAAGSVLLTGDSLVRFNGSWINIDDAVGVVTRNAQQWAFGNKTNNNSILTAKLYPAYSDTLRVFRAGETIGRHTFIYYSNISADDTQRMNNALHSLQNDVPKGWNGVLAPDPDGSFHFLLTHFFGSSECTLRDIRTEKGAPVFAVPTQISHSGSKATFSLPSNRSVSHPLSFFIQGSGVQAMQVSGSSPVVQLTASVRTTIQLHAFYNGRWIARSLTLRAGKTLKVNTKLKILNQD